MMNINLLYNTIHILMKQKKYTKKIRCEKNNHSVVASAGQHQNSGLYNLDYMVYLDSLATIELKYINV